MYEEFPEDLVDALPPRLARYRKAVMAVVAAVVAWATLVMTSTPAGVTAPEWLNGAILLCGALGVYQVPNAVAKLKS
jgi:hypothetical protein